MQDKTKKSKLYYSFFIVFIGHVHEVEDNLPELHIRVTYNDTGKNVTYFKEYVQIQYYDVMSDTLRQAEVKVNNQTLTSNLSCDCFSSIDGTTLTLYTKEIISYENICNVSHVIANIYYKPTPDGFDIKIFLTTVRTITTVSVTLKFCVAVFNMEIYFVKLHNLCHNTKSQQNHSCIPNVANKIKNISYSNVIVVLVKFSSVCEMIENTSYLRVSLHSIYRNSSTGHDQ